MWLQFHARAILSSLVIGSGYLIEPTVWGLLHLWQSDIWYSFSRETICSWTITGITNGLFPGILTAAAFSVSNIQRKKLVVILAVIFTLLFRDGATFLFASILACAATGDFLAPSYMAFAGLCDIFGGALAGILIVSLSNRVDNWLSSQPLQEAERIISQLSRIPRVVRICFIIIIMALLGPTIVTRIVPKFGFELAPSLSFIKLSREAYLDFEILSPNRIANWGIQRPLLVIANIDSTSHFPSELRNSEALLSSTIQLRLKYPETRQMRLFDLSVRQISEGPHGKFLSKPLMCNGIPKTPIDLEDTRIDFTCEIDRSIQPELRPLTNQELHAMMASLPGWGKGWQIAKNIQIQIRYATAASENGQRTFPVELLAPTAALQRGIEKRHQRRQQLEAEFVHATAKLNTRASLRNRLGASLKQPAAHSSTRPESAVYRCRGPIGSSQPLCRWVFKFNRNGQLTAGYWSNPEHDALDAKVHAFEKILQAARNQKDVVRLLGEPYLKISNEWYYPLPSAPEDILFTLTFGDKESLKSVSIMIRCGI